VGNATAFEIRKLATHVRQTVQAMFGVDLEEEVLYLGDWSRFS
jgi:UDP-N-acetylenolpyruvoylglucosamine reductase